MGFVRIFWKNNVQEAYLPKMSISRQIVSEIVAQLCLENSIQTLLFFFGSTLLIYSYICRKKKTEEKPTSIRVLGWTSWCRWGLWFTSVEITNNQWWRGFSLQSKQYSYWKKGSEYKMAEHYSFHKEEIGN